MRRRPLDAEILEVNEVDAEEEAEPDLNNGKTRLFKWYPNMFLLHFDFKVNH